MLPGTQCCCFERPSLQISSHYRLSRKKGLPDCTHLCNQMHWIYYPIALTNQRAAYTVLKHKYARFLHKKSSVIVSAMPPMVSVYCNQNSQGWRGIKLILWPFSAVFYHLVLCSYSYILHYSPVSEDNREHLVLEIEVCAPVHDPFLWTPFTETAIWHLHPNNYRLAELGWGAESANQKPALGQVTNQRPGSVSVLINTRE